jgi:methionyl-tRNA formyltransferase
MKFAFFGSPAFARDILERLIGGGMAPHVVVCNPDRPFGRKKILTPPPAKEVAIRHSIPVIQEMEKGMVPVALQECSFAVVAAYGSIIRKETLDAFKDGVIGVHPSLLPKYRGSSPIQSVILSGEPTTGVSLYRMDEKMDHGPVIASHEIALDDPLITYEQLQARLAQCAADMLLDIIPSYSRDTVAVEQDHDEATFTRKFTTEDGYVDLGHMAPAEISRIIRALNPDPGAFAYINNVRTKLLEVSADKDGSLHISKILPDGKKPQAARIPLS